MEISRTQNMRDMSRRSPAIVITVNINNYLILLFFFQYLVEKFEKQNFKILIYTLHKILINTRNFASQLITFFSNL